MQSFPKYRYHLIVIILIIIYGIINFYCTKRLSVTGDESGYYQYGVNVLKQHPQKELVNGVPLYNSQMPIIAINVLPRAIRQILHPSLKHNLQQTLEDVANARFFSVISAMLLALYVFAWSTQLYGRAAGFFSLLLYLFCPNILAHSQMVGTDVYSFLLCTATVYHAWRYTKTSNRKQLLLVAILLGIGQVSKQSLLLLYPVIVIFLLTRFYGLKISPVKRIALLGKELFIIALVSLLIINTGFLFYKTGQPLKQYQFISARFKMLQNKFSFIDGVPLPLPQPYIAGFDYVAFNSETPPGIEGLSSYGAGYFLGKPFTGKRIWYYYTVCCLYKLPGSFLLILFTSILFYRTSRKKFVFIKNELYLLLPVVFIFIFFSCYNTMYLGIKNILMILPLLFIFCGSLWATFLQTEKRKLLLLSGILLIWQLYTVVKYFPHFLPYTNEFITDKKYAYKIFGDANLYFQEGGILAMEYLNQHREIQWEPAKPVHGRVMVSLENYLDYWHEGKLQWLTSLHLEPSGHFHSQYLIFDIP
ncbi:MAG: glycosyltransferase family 39 protein [Ferruginibacter sp.]|nr:glycosyltransferase family 39 protein [Ferruginibacter sp.]